MPTYRVVVSPAARRDLRGILRATIRKWDERQSREYEVKLSKAVERLAQFPEMGAPLYAFGAEARAVMCEQHRIYYRVDDNVVLILRVLHEKMDGPIRVRSVQDRE